MNNMGEFHSFMRSAYVLEHTKRYSMVPVLKQESVASHCFFVSLGVRMLHTMYEFNLERALCLAISHDIAEAHISDINHAVKRSYPKLAAAIKEVEDEVHSYMHAAIREDLSIIDDNSVESKIVHFADALQVQQYAESEMQMGNKNMNDIRSSAVSRWKTLEKELEDWKRPGVSPRKDPAFMGRIPIASEQK